MKIPFFNKNELASRNFSFAAEKSYLKINSWYFLFISFASLTCSFSQSLSLHFSKKVSLTCGDSRSRSGYDCKGDTKCMACQNASLSFDQDSGSTSNSRECSFVAR